MFLDEIGELGLDEQAMLLHAIEEKEFYPVGSDKTVYSDFQLIAGTNQDLQSAINTGSFREDLLARIDMWNWRLPSLKERIEDFEANLEFELRQYSRLNNKYIRFGKEARHLYLDFALSEHGHWRANFRDLNASIKRMATLCKNGRIGEHDVNAEIRRLEKRWAPATTANDAIKLDEYVAPETLPLIDLFDQIQLKQVIAICKESANMAQAGRRLFNASRMSKSSTNDSHRLRTYLQKFGLRFSDINKV